MIGGEFGGFGSGDWVWRGDRGGGKIGWVVGFGIG